jgi:hypothetical protein
MISGNEGTDFHKTGLEKGRFFRENADGAAFFSGF